MDAGHAVFLNEVASIAWMDPIRAPLDSLRRSGMERKEGRMEGVGVAGAINGNADRRGDVRRRNRSTDRWRNIWRRKASALGGSAQRTCWNWLDMDFLSWSGLKYPVVSWYVEARNGVSLTAAETVSATNQAK